MATVLLPMGYPVLDGVQFDLIVFQNNLVRQYEVPKDPRTDSQLFQRRLFSDISKMRSYMGDVAKGALKQALGRTWSTVLLQIIKADSFSWWTDAINAWDSMSESDQQTWRDAAPYKVTFNDLGKVFYLLCVTAFKAIEHYGLGLWEAEDWQAGSASEALSWFTKSKGDIHSVQWVYFSDAKFRYYGSWDIGIWQQGGNSGNIKESSGSELDRAELLVYGKEIVIQAYKQPDYGSANIYIDGVLNGVVDFSGTSGLGQSVYDSTKRKIRSIVIKPVGSVRIPVFSVWSDGVA